jgi:predicted AlkP superfamily phosphohydrolase/phosphomutase
MSLGYIDPETAQHIFGGFGAWLLAFLGMVLGFILWPLRILYLRIRIWLQKQTKLVKFLCAVLGALFFLGLGSLGALAIRRSENSMAVKKADAAQTSNRAFSRVILLGMDGLDPNIMEEMMSKGELPNFSKLVAAGSYHRLQTSNPPESPVAWSTIATGCDPGEHGIFDFLHRDPKTYMPYLSLRKPVQGMMGTRYEKARKRDGFWAYTSSAKIPTTVIRWPVAFPAEQVTGRFLSGFGVPDLLGGEGRYAYFTSAEVAKDDPSPRNVVQVQWNGKSATTKLQGPATGKESYAELKMSISRSGTDSVSIEIDGAKPITAKRGEWSAWVPLHFSVGFSDVYGIIKFLLSEVEPNLRLTSSPIQMDPDKQAFAFTCPACFGRELQEQIGPFHTLGMPEQVHPLSHQRYDYDAFLSECRAVTDERRKMLKIELDRFQSGLLAFVFDTSDRIQHAFWTMRDPKHPAYDAKLAEKYKDVIPNMYREMDEILGGVLAKIDSQTALFVLSDHGFNSFRRAVHINRWLIQNGYMVLKDGAEKDGKELFRDVDWSQTRAYAVGFASIYLNLKGRERDGVVARNGEDRKLCEEIVGKLRDLKDPATGESAVKDVYIGADLYAGGATAESPDLVYGLRPGYRASWQTALGGAPVGLVEDNKKRWSGDHLIDPSFVPGVIFSNQKMNTADPKLSDIAPTILRCLAIDPPGHMNGKALINGR